VAAVLALIYGLKVVAQEGLSAGGVALVSVIAGTALGAIFVRRQMRLAQPLVDLRLFRNPSFSATIVTLTLNVFAIFGVMFFTAQYYQLVLGMDPLRAGLWMLPPSICVVASSLSSSRLVRLMSRTSVLVVGMGLCALGFAILALAGVGGLPVIVAGSIVWGLGAGPVGTLATDLIVGFAPLERAGSVASLSETSAELGGALGLALLGSLGVAIYRLSMSGVTVPGADLAAGHVARGTLGAAVAAAGTMPAEAGAALLAAARGAFTHAFVVVAVVSAVLMAVSAALLATVVARAQPPAHR
jgi:DHA2 family multidrug resistance protein-like MFS transporter